jgi:uncharacterized protein YcbX
LKNGAEPYMGKASHMVDGEEMISGGSSMGRDGNFFNLIPLHIVTTGSLRAREQVAPASAFDPQRFRPNIVIETPGAGFPEVDWPGRTLQLGSTRLLIKMIVPRCVVTILAQGQLPKDPEVLRTISTSNAIDIFNNGTRYPCLDVYAEVLQPGAVHVGEVATLG